MRAGGAERGRIAREGRLARRSRHARAVHRRDGEHQRRREPHGGRARDRARAPEPGPARRGAGRAVPGRRLRRRRGGRGGAREDDVRRGRQLDRLHPRPGRARRAALRVAHAAVRLHLLRLRLREAAPLAVHHGVDAPQEPLVAVLAGQDRLRGRARPRLARAGLPGDDRPAEPDLRHPPADRDRGLGLRDAPRSPAAAAGRSSSTGTGRACGRSPTRRTSRRASWACWGTPPRSARRSTSPPTRS